MMKVSSSARAFLAGVAVSAVAAVGLLFGVPATAHRTSAAAQPFPRMQSALNHLQAAKSDLQASLNVAPGDHFEGHRSQALQLVDQAINQTKWGMNVGN